MCNNNGTAKCGRCVVPATAVSITFVLMVAALWCVPAFAAPPRRIVQASQTGLGEAARGLPVRGSLRVEGVQFEGSTTALELERIEAFTPDAKVVIADDHGERVLPAPDNAYYRGAVEGDLAAVAVLTARANGRVRGLIVKNGQPWVISDEPPSPGVRGLSTRKVDLVKEFGNRPFRCDVEEAATPPPDLDAQPAALATESAALPAVNYTARVAVETDYEFFQLFGNTTDATDYVGDLFAYASTIYESELNTSLLVSYLKLWTTSADPWIQTDCGSVLTEFQSYWNQNNTGVNRTIAQMLSGKRTGCGIAYVGVLCSASSGYSVSGNLNGNFNIANPGVVWDIFVVSHELGHTFNTPHTHCYNGIGGSTEPVDKCYSGESGCYSGPVSLPCSAGAGHGCGTIMSYCHLRSGGYGNIALTFGTGFQYGVLPDRVPTRMHNFLVSRAASFPSCLALMTPTNIPTSTPTPTPTNTAGATPTGPSPTNGPAATPTPTAAPLVITTVCSAASTTSNKTIACSPTHDTTLNNAVIVCVVDNTTGGAPTMADSQNAACTGNATPWSCCTGSGTGTCNAGNPYTQNTTVSNTAGTTRITLFSAPIAHQIKTTDAIKATLSNNVQYKSISVLEVAGLEQSASTVTVDVHPPGTAGNSASPTLSSGPLGYTDELVVACLGVQANSGTTYSGLIAGGASGIANDGATVAGSAGTAGGTTPRQLWPEYEMLPTTNPFTAGGPNSLSAAKQWALALVSFKHAAAATVTPTPTNSPTLTSTAQTNGPTATPTPTAAPLVVTSVCSATSSTSNKTIACSPAHDTTLNNAVIVCVVDNTTGGTPTLADSQNAACTGNGAPWSCCTGSGRGTCSAGNTYTQNNTVSNTTGTTRVTLFSAPITHQIKSTDTIKATLSNNVQYKSISVLEVAGLEHSASTVTADVHPTGATGNSTSPSLSSGALAYADELIVACLGVQANAGTTYSGLTAGGAGGVANDGATVTGSAGTVGGTTPRELWPEYKNAPTTNAFTAGGPNSLSAAKQWALTMVSFKRF